MSTIAEQLMAINQVKTDIANAIQSKGVNPSGVPFTSYPFLINQIQGGSGQTGLSSSFYNGVWSYSDYMYILNNMTGYAYTGDEIDVSILNTVDDMLCVMLDATTGASNFFGVSITTTDPEVPGANTWRIDWSNQTFTEHQNGEVVRRFLDLNETWGTHPIIKVTPINGTRFKAVNLGVEPSSVNDTRIQFESTYLDIAFKGTVTESFTVCNPGSIVHPYLRSVFIGENMVSNFNDTFKDCKSLRRVQEFHTAHGQSFMRTFSGCISLVTIPPIDTSNCIEAVGMFEGTRSLMTVPFLNLGNLRNGGAMFYESGIISFPDSVKFGGNTLDKTELPSMFSGCRNLKRFPVCDFTNVSNLDFFFSQCVSLEYVEAINSSSCTRFPSMFSECKKLLYGPNIDTSNAEWINDMFAYCDILESAYVNCDSLKEPMTIFRDCPCLRAVTVKGISTHWRFDTTATPFEVVKGSSNLTEIDFGGLPVYLNSVKLSGRIPAWILNNAIANMPPYSVSEVPTVDFSSLKLDQGQIDLIAEATILAKGYQYIPPTLVY